MGELLMLLAIIACIFFIVENFFAILWFLGIVVAIIALVMLYVYLSPLVADCFLSRYGNEEQKTKVRIKREHRHKQKMAAREKKRRARELEKARHAKDISVFNVSKRRKIRVYQNKRNELIRNYGDVTDDFVIEEYNINQEILVFGDSKLISLMGKVIPFEMLIRCKLDDRCTDSDVYSRRVMYYTLMVSVYDLNTPVINVSMGDKEKLLEIESFLNGIIAQKQFPS